jgi:hypothetical protein
VAVDEPQWPERTVIAKNALATTHDNRVDHQPELVDQFVFDQRVYQLGAADYV